jgi:hypothetical protein
MEDEMDELCGTHGTRREMHAGFWCENIKERKHLEGLEINR